MSDDSEDRYYHVEVDEHGRQRVRNVDVRDQHEDEEEEVARRNVGVETT